MNAASGFLAYLLAPLSAANLQGFSHVLGELLFSANPLFWFLAAVLARFGLPDILLWLVNTFHPSTFAAPSGKTLPTTPLVSVVIAGRNVGGSVVATIESTLACGYPHLEVIYVDDFSSDDSVAKARVLEKTGRVRVFETKNHNGKPTSLNIGLSMARGEFIFVLDADSELQPGSIGHLLAPFADPEVGAVAANLRVRNATRNAVTRLQECEYALNVSLPRLWRGRLNLLSILPGAGSMFRADALRALGGYDTGLGDDTDLTVRLRKQGWKLRFALHGVVWTDVPDSYPWLLRQRSRWARNMVKVRLHKQGDLYRAWRFGIVNALIQVDILLFRMVLPFLALGYIVYLSGENPRLCRGDC